MRVLGRLRDPVLLISQTCLETGARISNLLLEHVRAHAGFALRKGGERVLANVYRLIDIARRFEVNDATCPRSSRAPLL
jgi:hypothetical protein